MVRRWWYAVFRSIARGASRLLLPERCMYCGVLFERGDRPSGPPRRSLCEECRERLEPPASVGCLRCGRFQDWVGLPKESCRKCVHREIFFDRVVPLGRYEGELRLAILHMKRPEGRGLAELLARMLYEARRPLLEEMRPDVVVPVPMHWLFRWTRGMNNPEIVANVLGRLLDRDVQRLATCTRMRLSQRAVPMDQRQRNVVGMYVPAYTEDVTFQFWKGKHALLVDDVITSGATCNEIARILKQDLGFARVTVAAIARAPGNQEG